MPSYFERARDFNVGEMRVENIKGNYTTEHHTNIHEEEVGRETYDQEGAVGVVNGRGRFSGTINHGGNPPKARQRPPPGPTLRVPRHERRPASEERPKGPAKKPMSDPSSDRGYASSSGSADRTHSQAKYFQDAERLSISSMDIKNIEGDRTSRDTKHVHKKYVRERVYNQRGAIGVVNDRGTFSGTINYGVKNAFRSSKDYDSESDQDEGSESESDEDSSEEEPRSRSKHSTAGRYKRTSYDSVISAAVYNQQGGVGIFNDRARCNGNFTVNYAAATDRFSKMNLQREWEDQNSRFSGTQSRRWCGNVPPSHTDFGAAAPSRNLGTPPSFAAPRHTHRDRNPYHGTRQRDRFADV
ncbi:hypothetical protein NMY22_g15180 [Coprinellus aureogranulatus]|nr:hypothetical protein NMY22_g15180 [Coprinellus aureogranulatus]